MKRTNLLLMAVFGVSFGTFAQEPVTLSLDSCYSKAIANYPLIKQKALQVAIYDLKIKNIKTNYYPQLNLNAQATYQSDVTTLPIKIPGMEIPSLANDQYKASLDISQTIYDGGASSVQKKIENISLQLDQENINLETYKVKLQINSIFFNILVLKENKALLLSMKEEIQSKLKKIEAGIKNGAILESNANQLKAEVIKIDQQITELDAGIKASLKMLGDYLNTELPDDTKLIAPEITSTAKGYDNNRIEKNVFKLQIEKLNTSKSFYKVKTSPKLSSFGQFGYGRPGLNMLSNEFNPYFLVGLKFNWNIWDWNQNSREKQILDLQSNLIKTQEETFNKNLTIVLVKNIADIDKYDELIAQDNQIIELRKKIVETAASQLENGIITATEYLTEMNASTQALLNLKTHQIQQVKARVDYLINKGNL